jgi:aryl-alcohol dehydrogenase-like predicted oxidoreductase
MQQIVDETIPALPRSAARREGAVHRVLRLSQKIFRFICDQTDVDCVLSYNQYTLQTRVSRMRRIPYLKAKGVGVMNAGPFSARLLTNAPLPTWLKGARRR